MQSNNKADVIYLVRHGHIATESRERLYIGQIEVPLSQTGKQQARLLQSHLAAKEISVVYCSDLMRSVDTANIIAEGLDTQIIVRNDLREISMGNWEGKSFSEIAQCQPAEYAARGRNIISYRVPGGESFAECQARVMAAFADIVNCAAGNIVIVGHAGINRLLLCHVLGMPLENIFRIVQDYGCMNILVNDKGQYRIKLLNGCVDN